MRSATAFARADKNADRAERYLAIRDIHSGAAVVRSEPRVYGPDSPNSLLHRHRPQRSPGLRLSVRRRPVPTSPRYARELAVEIKADSAEGRRAKRATRCRSPMAPGSRASSDGLAPPPPVARSLPRSTSWTWVSTGFTTAYPPQSSRSAIPTPRPGLRLAVEHPGILLRHERRSAEWPQRQRRRVDHALSIDPASVPGDAFQRNRGLPVALRPHDRPARRRD